MMSSEQTGEMIRNFRRARQMSQADLADAIGISCTHMSYIETGRKNASLTVLKSIAELFQISVDSLVNEPETTENEPAPLKEILSDCSEYEEKVLTAVSSELKKAMREYSYLMGS